MRRNSRLLYVLLLCGGLPGSTASAAPGGSYEVPMRTVEAPYSFMHGAFDEEEPGVLDTEATEVLLDRIPSTTYSAAQLSATMFFDETCWEELYGPSAPQVDPKPNLADRAHCFTRADGTEVCWNTEEVETYWADVEQQVEQYNLNDAVWSSYPYTNGHIDTRFWTTQADEAFWNCLGPDEQNIYGIAALPPPDAASCLQQVRNQYGEPCRAITATTKDEICRDFEYYQSWCGRLEMDAQDGNANWACIEVLEDAANEMMTDPTLPHESLLLPERLLTPDGEEIHLLDHAYGPRLKIYEQSPMVTANVFDTEGTATADAMAAHEAEVAAWDADPSIGSCEEYAYDRTYGLAELDRLAAAHRHDPRWIFDYAHQGSPPRVAGELYEQRDGTPMALWMAQGGGPWAFIDPVFGSEANAGELAGEPRIYRGGPAFRGADSGAYWLHDWFGPGEVYTFKNVYAYLHALRQGPPTNWSPDSSAAQYNVTPCEAWRTTQRLYYGDEYFDHGSMNQRMNSRGFTDDDYAYAQQKQDELWALFLRFVDETDLTVRRNLLQEIDERLLEGELLGCIPASHTYSQATDDAALTVCDWSPRFFALQSADRLVRLRDEIYDECVDAVGTALDSDGNIDAAALHQSYRDPSGYCAAGIPAYKCTSLQNQFANLQAMTPLQDHASLEQFINARNSYWTSVNHAVSQLPPEALNPGSSHSHAKSTKQHFFGAGTTGTYTSGLREAQDPTGGGGTPPCYAEPHVESDTATGIRVFGTDIPILEHFLDVLSETLLDYRQGHPNDTLEKREVETGLFNFGVRGKGHFAYNPELQQTEAALAASVEFSAAIQARYSIQYSVFTLSVTAGASGGAALEAGLALTSGPTTSTPTEACETRRTTVSFQIEPKIDIDAMLDAGVGVGIANILELSVGIGGRLRLIGLGWPTTIALNWDYKPKPDPNMPPAPQFWGSVTSYLTADSMSGNLYLFARLTGPFGIKLFEALWEFASWRKDKVKRHQIAGDVFAGDAYCEHLLDVAPQGQQEEDPILCMCSDDPNDVYAAYCEN